MQKHRVRIVLVVCGVVLLSLVAIKVRSNNGRAKALPDETLLKFEGVTQPGKIILYGNPLQKALDRWIPFGTRRILGFPIRKAERLYTLSDPNGACLGVWFSIHTASLLGDALHQSAMNDYRFVAVGSSGQEFENAPERILLTLRPTLGETKVVEEVKLNRFPRTEKQFALKVLRRNGTGWDHAATFTIPNPLSSQTTRWTPVSVPHTNSFQEVAMALEKCAVVPRDGPNGNRLETELSFKFFTNGIPTTDLGIFDCVLHDEEGNYGIAFDHVRDGDSLIVKAPFALATNRVWRVRITIGRRRNFPQDEQVHLRNLSTAGNASHFATNRSGDVALVSTAEDSFSCAPKSSPTDTMVTILDVRDESGAKIKLLQQFRTADSTQGTFTTPPPSFYLTLAIHRTMTVELFVKPEFSR